MAFFKSDWSKAELTRWLGSCLAAELEQIETRPDTRHKMRLVRVLLIFENNMGRTDLWTDGRTDTTSFRDATAYLKNKPNRVRTTDAFSLTARVLVFESLLFNGTLSYSWCHFVQIRTISQKFNSCVTDVLTEGRTDGRTYPVIEMWERI